MVGGTMFHDLTEKNMFFDMPHSFNWYVIFHKKRKTIDVHVHTYNLNTFIFIFQRSLKGSDSLGGNLLLIHFLLIVDKKWLLFCVCQLCIANN